MAATREELLATLRRDVHDEHVLAALAAVPRETFVEPVDQPRAWENVALPIGCGQTISQPLVVARICELLRVRPGDRLLDVGTGSGYQAAVFAALGARVVGIEVQPALATQAARRLPGVRVVVGDGRLGWPAGAPYDGICVAAATEEIPPALLSQLAPGGRLVAPLRDGGHERLVLARRTRAGVVGEDHEAVRFVPLV